jgi:hypothetical protein
MREHNRKINDGIGRFQTMTIDIDNQNISQISLNLYNLDQLKVNPMFVLLVQMFQFHPKYDEHIFSHF